MSAVSVSGCGETDQTKPSYWIEKLEGDQARTAINKLAEMKAPESVDPLMKAFEKSTHRYEIIAALTKIGDKKAVPTLLAALADVSDAKTGQLAGNTLLEWDAKEHLGEYLKVLANTKIKKETKLAVMELLAKFADTPAADQLVGMLELDPDIEPIVFLGLAAEGVGNIGAEKLGPERTKKAVDGLLRCMWLDDALGRNEVMNCRMALNKLGPKASADAIIATLERKNREVEKRARKFGFNVGGTIEFKTAELLSDMKVDRALDPLLAALTKVEEPTPAMQADGKKMNAFVMSGVQKVISITNALALIGDEKAVDPMLKLVLDDESPLEKRLAAVQQLAFLGSQKPVKDLVKFFKSKDNLKAFGTQGFRLNVAITLGNLIDGTDAKTFADFDKTINTVYDQVDAALKKATADYKTASKGAQQGLAADIQGYREWLKGYTKVKEKLAVVKECKDEVGCLVKKLDDEKTHVKVQAAHRLAQKADAKDTVIKALLARAGTEDMVVRNALLFGLDRLGDSSLVPELQKIRDKDAEKAAKNKKLRGLVNVMDLTLAKMAHRGK
ncbi:MAG: HEAT repeat domain-containing protein [Bradymonadia bacterium]